MSDSHDIDREPVPCYATAEEVALAERLLRKIEERYLQNDSGCGEEPQPLRKAA